MNPMRLDALPDLSRWHCAVVPPLGHSTPSTLRCGPGDGSTQPANHRFFPRSFDQTYGCNHGKNPWIISIYSISSSSLFSWAIAFGKGGPKFVSSDLGDSLGIEYQPLPTETKIRVEFHYVASSTKWFWQKLNRVPKKSSGQKPLSFHL